MSWNLSFFLSLRKISSTTSAPSSPRAAARRGREQEMRKHLRPSPRRLAAELKTPPTRHPARTSPPSWRGSFAAMGSGGRRPAAPAPWSLSWPRGGWRSPSLPRRSGAAGPAPTPTAACCRTARCASSRALLLASSQVGLRNNPPLILYLLVCSTISSFLHFTDCKKKTICVHHLLLKRSTWSWNPFISLFSSLSISIAAVCWHNTSEQHYRFHQMEMRDSERWRLACQSLK